MFWLLIIEGSFLYVVLNSFQDALLSTTAINAALVVLVLISWLSAFYLMYVKNQASVILAFYFLFLIVIIAEKITFSNIDLKSLLASAGFFLALALITAMLYQELRTSIKGKTILAFVAMLFVVLIYLVPASFIAYYIDFLVPVDQNAIRALLQTDALESVEFTGDFVGLKTIVGFVVLLSLICYFFIWHRISNIVFIERNMLLATLGLAVVTVALTFPNSRLPKFISSTIEAYQVELELFKKERDKREVDANKIIANKDGEGETYIIIIGESLNKQHMQIYGYPRQTTPNLSALDSQNKLIKFENVYANHTHTVPVLSLSLTEATQYGGKNYYQSASIVEIYKRAGFQTYWITNQNLLGTWDNLVSIVANQSDKVTAINRSIGTTTATQKYDESLIPYVEKALRGLDKSNKAIFVHIIGNHGDYCKRFTKGFEKFSGALPVDIFGKNLSTAKKENVINCYDNSVLYNDYVVHEIIKLLASQLGKNALIYFADHADDVISGLGHNSAKFTFDMTQVPLIFWFSDAFAQAYPTLIAQLNNHKNALFSNDLIYDTLIGWSGIKTANYNAAFDLTSEKYSLPESKAKTLHGKRLYADKSNHLYWQRKNTNILLDKNLATRFFPHRVNSIGKLMKIWEMGFRAFEIDIIFDYKSDGKFYVGHNDGVMGTDLASFLSSIDIAQLDKIWLDFKNLNAKHYKAALAELNMINDSTNLKGKAILESGWTADTFKIFREQGWQTSYYLPTGIAKTLADKDIDALKNHAKNIAEQVRAQQVQSVSFDTKLYPFIKSYLEPLLANEITYHAWYGPSLDDSDLPEMISKERIYQDQRIKTFLMPVKTHFDL